MGWGFARRTVMLGDTDVLGFVLSDVIG